MSALPAETKNVWVGLGGEVVQRAARMSQSLVKSGFFQGLDLLLLAFKKWDGSLNLLVLDLEKKLLVFPQKLRVVLGKRRAEALVVPEIMDFPFFCPICKVSLFSFNWGILIFLN